MLYFFCKNKRNWYRLDLDKVPCYDAKHVSLGCVENKTKRAEKSAYPERGSRW